MSGSTNVYVIWYGAWGSGAQGIINTWLSNVGGSNFYGVNARYYDSNGPGSSNEYVQNVINYNSSTNSYVDTTDYNTYGTSITDTNVQTFISNAISGGQLPADSNGVYFVLTGTSVNETGTSFGTFCSDYIAYHGVSTNIVAGDAIKYAFVGKPTCDSAVS